MGATFDHLDVDTLIQRMKHCLIHISGQTSDTATSQEFYQAFCMALYEEIMIHWTASRETKKKEQARTLYFLSMEYLPGRLTGNNLANMGGFELIKQVLAKMNRSMSELLACEPDPGLGNGGLGRLASCFLDSLATLHYPTKAYGLRYQYGIFEQELWNGQQVERPDCWLLNANPWEQRRDPYATTVFFRGRPIRGKNKRGEEVETLEEMEEVRAIPFDLPVVGFGAKDPFSVITLRLWSTKESPRNFQLQRYNAGLLDQAAENTCLTDVLYPNEHTETGKRIRLKQEFLLVSASVQDIFRDHLKLYGDVSRFAEKTRIQINDTHPALAIVEVVRILLKRYDYSWEEAWNTCQEICSYTNHTILKEALEEWNEGRVAELLPRQYRIIQHLNLQFCNGVRRRFPNDEERVRRLSIIENNQLRMAHLAIVGSHAVNGVAELHTEILKRQIFPDFYELSPEKFRNVTNGVTHRRWLFYANPLLASFLNRQIGDGWISDFRQIEALRELASRPEVQREFLLIKKKNKERLIEELLQHHPIRDHNGHPIAPLSPFDPSALFDVQIKRIHEYKRQLMHALHLIMLIQEYESNPHSNRVKRLVLFGGKAAAGYERAKQIVSLICAIARFVHQHPLLSSKLQIVFLENYNVSKAELLIPAADLSEQISTAGWEASGTGNMKLAMNGALTIGTEDGANIEMRKAVGDRWWPFSFGANAEENLRPYSAKAIYRREESIRRAVDTLIDGKWAQTEGERESFRTLYQSLLEGENEADRFRVIGDLLSYAQTQKKVEELYQQPAQWAEMALHNIGAMGPFSADESVRRYAEEIWGIEPCPLNKTILDQVRQDYVAHDRCTRDTG